MKDLPSFGLLELYSAVLAAGCVIIILKNTYGRFSQLDIISYPINFHIRPIFSFMAASGLLLFVKTVTKTPFLRTSGCDANITNFCSNDASTSNLPTDWFVEVNNEFFAANSGFQLYCIVVIYYALFFFVIEHFWFRREEGQVGELIPLVNSTILPNDDKEKRKEIIVLHMISKMRENSFYFLSFVLAEILCLVLGIFGLIYNPAAFLLPENKFFGNPDFAVKLNGSEWVVDCNRQVTPQDAFTLTKFLHIYSDCEYGDICIIPTATIYFHLYNAIWFCFATLVISCVPILICRIYEICFVGHRVMNDVLLMRLLKKNVDYTQHKDVVDAFRRKLYEKRRASENGTTQARQAVATCNKGRETATHSVKNFLHMLSSSTCRNHGNRKEIAPPGDT